MNPDTVPPHDLDAEEAIIGSLLLDPACLDDVLRVVAAESFYSPKFARAFGGIVELVGRGEGLDAVTLKPWLSMDDSFAATNNVPCAANVDYYARIVAGHATRRRVLALCQSTQARAHDTTIPPPEVVEGLLAELGLIECHGKRQASLIADVLSAVQDELESFSGGRRGISTGFGMLDAEIGGLHPGELTIVAGRPGMGKTTLWWNSLLNQALDGHAVGLVSLEMTQEQLVRNMLCREAHIHSATMRYNSFGAEECKRAYGAAEKLSKLPMVFLAPPSITTEALRAEARLMVRRHKVQVIGLDYLQLVHGVKLRKSDNRNIEVGQVSQTLKEIARELEVPVVACAQLNRAVDARDNREPRLSDLRESGQIEQDADVVLMLHRPEMVDPRPDHPRQGECDVHIAKHRHGGTGKVVLGFNAPYFKFSSVATAIQAKGGDR